MTTTNNNFRVKNGLEVATTATVEKLIASTSSVHSIAGISVDGTNPTYKYINASTGYLRTTSQLAVDNSIIVNNDYTLSASSIRGNNATNSVAFNDGPVGFAHTATLSTLKFADGVAITSRSELIGPTGYTGSIGSAGPSGPIGYTGSSGSGGSVINDATTSTSTTWSSSYINGILGDISSALTTIQG
jgi:hypothetical protein